MGGGRNLSEGGRFRLRPPAPPLAPPGWETLGRVLLMSRSRDTPDRAYAVWANLPNRTRSVEDFVALGATTSSDHQDR